MESLFMEAPKSGEIYKHHKGGKYIVQNVVKDATNETCGRYMVLYSRYEIGEVNTLYVRDLEEFMGNTEDGKKRFAFVGK